MSAIKGNIRTGNQPATAEGNVQTPSPPVESPWIRLSDLDNHGDFWLRVKTEFETIAGTMPTGETDDRKRERGELLIGDIATLTGFSISDGTLSFNEANAQIGKFTYHIAFRLPFKTISVMQNGVRKPKSFPGSFENWWKGANRIRLKHWQDNASTQNATIYKRLCKNGEAEIWEQTSVPTDEITPQMQANPNTSEARYNYFGVTMHKRLKDSFFTNGNSQVPLPYYFKASVEAPFYTHWTRFSRCFPYNVTNDNGIPYPVSGFDKIIISNIKYLDATTNQLVATTDFFYPTSRGVVKNYKHFPELGAVVANNPNAALNGKIQISAYKHTKVNVQTTGTTPKKNFDKKKYTVQANGDIYSKVNDKVIKNEAGTANYNPDIFNNVDFVNELTFYDVATDKIYIRELTPITLYADYTLAGTVQANQLIGHKIYGITTAAVTEFSALVPQSTAVGNYASEDTPPLFIIGISGITIGIGVDVGNSFDNSDAAPNPARRTYFENTIMTNNCPNWSALSNTDKNIVRQGYGLHDQAGENHWLRHLVLFNKLNLQLNNNSFYNVLRDTVGFGRQFYYEGALTHLRDKGLKTELNISEEYAILTLTFNSPGSVSAAAESFAAAINEHSQPKFLAAIDGMKKKNYSKRAVRDKLDSTHFKTYYNENHYHNLS